MKLPSLHALALTTTSTCKRFPLAVVFTITGCWFGILINHLPYENGNQHHYYTNIAMSAYLGMLLAISVAIYNESRNFFQKTKILTGVFVIILIIAYYASLSDHFTLISVIRFILFMTGLHLLVAFLPFIPKGGVNGFWQYNKSIFLRILIAVLYSVVLYIGLSVALLAIEKLFNVNIPHKWYADLWIAIAGIFNTIFFLAGFPSGFEKLEEKKDYPRGLKIFTQYVLLPIIAVYLLILYAYMFKIILNRQWPYGWVSYLVLAFAVAGILSLLLIHPVRNEEGNKWILLFSRFFYFAICPLVILLFLAIERRIGDYGITEERYFVLVLAIWLAFIALYFLLSKKKNIMVIPVSLCLIAFLASFGPWGAFSVSLKSQRARLHLYLLMNDMLPDGQKVVAAKGRLHKGDASQISSIIRYLVNVHGYESLQPFFTQNLDSLMKTNRIAKWNATYEASDKLLVYMKVDETDDENERTSDRSFSLRSDKENPIIPITGYDYLINNYTVSQYNEDDTLNYSFPEGGKAIKMMFLRDPGKLLLQTEGNQPITMDVAALAGSLRQNNTGLNTTVNQDSLTLTGENNDMTVKCIFRDIYGIVKNDSLKINQLTFDILVKLKHPGPGK